MKEKLLYRIMIKDKNGKIVKKGPWVPCKSFVLQYRQLMYSLLANTGVSVKDTGGINQSVITTVTHAREHWFNINSGDNVSTWGVVVGTGDTAPTNSDYQLETQVAHGTGAGQLDYGTHSFTAPSVVGANVDMVVSRDFYNGSGGTITVKEIGVYLRTIKGALDYVYFCIIRDTLAAGQDVLDTQTLTVQYTMRTTV